MYRLMYGCLGGWIDECLGGWVNWIYNNLVLVLYGKQSNPESKKVYMCVCVCVCVCVSVSVCVCV